MHSIKDILKNLPFKVTFKYATVNVDKLLAKHV